VTLNATPGAGKSFPLEDEPVAKGRSINVKGKLSVIVCAVFGLSLLSGLPADAASSRVKYTSARVIRWVDGDTVKTSKGTIRLIGVDTPERNRCGYAKAKKYAKAWAPAGSKIKLGDPKSVINKDKYGRKLRYVIRGKRDVSRSQIQKGSRARYDSRDGYEWHPREARYRRTDSKHPNYKCSASKPKPSGGSGPTAPNGNSCPASAPIKGNQGSPDWIYHRPGQGSYDVTTPEECFATGAAAEAAGYRAARN
jgi:endonuclease YncB( thermonuclease family)